jgi:hypothetical protein
LAQLAEKIEGEVHQRALRPLSRLRLWENTDVVVERKQHQIRL